MLCDSLALANSLSIVWYVLEANAVVAQCPNM